MAESNNNNRAGFISGIILLVLGFIFLFDQLNIFDIHQIWHYMFSWRTLLIVLGLIFAVNRRNRTLGLIMIGAGILFWALEFSGIYVGRNVIFPVILILIGLALLLRRHDVPAFEKTNSDVQNETIASDYCDDKVTFSNRYKKVVEENFKGGKFETVFGRMDLDLRAVKMTAVGITLDCETVFGNMNLIIPEDWTVKSTVSTVAGAYNDKRMAQVFDPEKVLYLKGEVVFGNMEIRNF